MPRLRIGLVQLTLTPLDIWANVARLEGAIADLAHKGAELVLLPELWSTGPLAPGDRASAHETPGLLRLLQARAAAHGMTFVGSLPELSEGRLYNTAFVVGPEGTLGSYRKIHLFAPFGEDAVFVQGDKAMPVWMAAKAREVALGPLICFDLRFPELSRHLVWQGAQLLVVCALWPASRRAHLDLLLVARAVENQCFVAAVNAWGPIGGTLFGGGSCVIDPTGKVLGRSGDAEADTAIDLDLEDLHTTRQPFRTAYPNPGWWPRCGQKLVDLPELALLGGRRRAMGQRLVFTNGCFDLLHAGHVTYLEAARRRGDFLAVGLNSDRSVRLLKGPDRPVNPDGMRAQVLAGLSCVDCIALFDEPTPIRLIEALRPDVLVKGADWAEQEIVGADIVRSYGGEVVRVSLVSDLSTTRTIERIRGTLGPG